MKTMKITRYIYDGDCKKYLGRIQGKNQYTIEQKACKQHAAILDTIGLAIRIHRLKGVTV